MTGKVGVFAQATVLADADRFALDRYALSCTVFNEMAGKELSAVLIDQYERR